MPKPTWSSAGFSAAQAPRRALRSSVSITITGASPAGGLVTTYAHYRYRHTNALGCKQRGGLEPLLTTNTHPMARKEPADTTSQSHTVGLA